MEKDPFLVKDETINLVSQKANSIRSNYFLNTFNNFKRIMWILFGPFYSGGLRLESTFNYFEISIKTIQLASIKFLNFTMRISLFFCCLNLYRLKSIGRLKLLNTSLLFLFSDVAFCLYLGQIEQRYLNDSFLYFQLSLIIEYLNIFKFK